MVLITSSSILIDNKNKGISMRKIINVFKAFNNKRRANKELSTLLVLFNDIEREKHSSDHFQVEHMDRLTIKV